MPPPVSAPLFPYPETAEPTTDKAAPTRPEEGGVAPTPEPMADGFSQTPDTLAGPQPPLPPRREPAGTVEPEISSVEPVQQPPALIPSATEPVQQSRRFSPLPIEPDVSLPRPSEPASPGQPLPGVPRTPPAVSTGVHREQKAPATPEATPRKTRQQAEPARITPSVDLPPAAPPSETPRSLIPAPGEPPPQPEPAVPNALPGIEPPRKIAPPGEIEPAPATPPESTIRSRAVAAPVAPRAQAETAPPPIAVAPQTAIEPAPATPFLLSSIATRQETPTVRVHIGSIDVRATTPAQTPAARRAYRPRPKPQPQGFDAYASLRRYMNWEER